jgi:hypothetical protein
MSMFREPDFRNPHAYHIVVTAVSKTDINLSVGNLSPDAFALHYL